MSKKTKKKTIKKAKKVAKKAVKRAVKKIVRKVKVKPHVEKIVAVSGGFDPVHIGHVRMFNEAKKLGDRLVVILNNDNWLRLKKGYVFMPENERKEIIESFASVDEVVLSHHKENTTDISICEELKLVRPHIFAKGGDRHSGNIPESPVCEQIGCTIVNDVGAGGKVQSSSWLIAKSINEAPCVCGSGKKHKECCGSKILENKIENK
ncbi:MAG: adenylyltransferase/cytidyltransferase family protein [Candidatus Paceibacterota bacterium]